jgi:hypothetical protein
MMQRGVKSYRCMTQRGIKSYRCMTQWGVKSYHCMMKRGVKSYRRMMQRGVKSENFERLPRPLKGESCKNHIWGAFTLLFHLRIMYYKFHSLQFF